jgi:hypothetical protein
MPIKIIVVDIELIFTTIRMHNRLLESSKNRCRLTAVGYLSLAHYDGIASMLSNSRLTDPGF